MTAEELHRELDISQVAVRQHLSSLEAEGSITVSVERRGLGRPSHRYMLTAHGDENFPRRYDALANDLLDELRAWQGEEAVEKLLSRHRDREQANLMPRMQDKSLGARLNELARTQTEAGFMTEISQDGPDTFALVKHNCAFCAVARNHPDVCCKSEPELIQHLLGDVEVVQESAIVDGDHACRFRIRLRTSETLAG
jgi:predicted ArsR family transcriptional regulator